MANRILKPDSSNNLILQDGDSVSRVTLNAGGTSVLSDEGGTSALSIQADGDIDIAENIYLASGKGIYFDGGTTSANYLGGSDAYEEGTWALVATGSDTTSPDGSAGPAGNYTKIGNVVHVQINFMPDADMVSGTTGNLRISIPFVGQQSGFQTATGGAVMIHLVDFSGSYVVVGISSDAAYVEFYQITDDASWSNLTWAGITGGADQMRMSFTYFTTL